MNRLTFLLAFPCLLLLLAANSASQEAPVVSTAEGQVSGITEVSSEGKSFYSYYGIPYARPPVGELRFKDPVVHEGWSGVRNGSSMPQPCLQIPFAMVTTGIRAKIDDLFGDEDCLVLNVFVPKEAGIGWTPRNRKILPVMVFIHGGGFFGGGAMEYLPHVLLNRGIILVIIQYRLGFLGFLSTEDAVVPGNYGLKDQTLALRWVQRNIRHFGGDPKRVTIFGESAGSASVHHQMLSPKAKGLFSGAIMQSGTSVGAVGMCYDSKELARKIGTVVGCHLSKGSLEYLKCMQEADPREVILGFQEVWGWELRPLGAGPRIDGDFLPDHPLRLMKEGRYNKVCLMAGVTAHEAGLVTKQLHGHRRHLLEDIRNNFTVAGPVVAGVSPVDKNISRSLAVQIFNYYLGGMNIDVSNADALNDMMSDTTTNFGHDVVTMLNAENGSPTFRYELTHKGQLSIGDFTQSDVGRDWVTHGDDLYYLFRGGPALTPSIQPPERPKDLSSDEDLAVRDMILTLWTNFATYGHPTPDNDALGFQWEPTGPDDLLHLEISKKPSMKSDTRKGANKFLLSLPTQMNFILNPHLLKEEDLAS